MTVGRTPGRDTARVFYDGECTMCTALARRWRDALRAQGFDLVPLQTPGVGELLGVSRERLGSQMWVLTRDGAVLGGADAWIHVARHARWLWWARPFVLMSTLPGGAALIRWAYGWVAAHRHCFGGACSLANRKRPRAGR